MTREEIKDFCDMKAQLEPENEDIFKAIVKILEQESILDKIRAEIEQNAYPIVHGVNSHELGMTLYGILQILDKYKTESEE